MNQFTGKAGSEAQCEDISLSSEKTILTCVGQQYGSSMIVYKTQQIAPSEKSASNIILNEGRHMIRPHQMQTKRV